jgi:hypothetical protein
LDEAKRHAHQSLEIRERLGLKEVFRDYDALADIARARGDAAQAAEWERKRDAVRAELKRRAQGPGRVPQQFARAIQQLSNACAQAGFGQAQPRELAPAEESALAQIEKLPAPLNSLASFLRELAQGKLPALPPGLPAELHQILAQLLEGVKEARQ